MQIHKIAIVLAAALTSVRAIAIKSPPDPVPQVPEDPERPDDVVVTKTWTYHNGTLALFYKNSTDDSAILQARQTGCGQNIVHCANSNLAPRQACYDLIYGLNQNRDYMVEDLTWNPHSVGLAWYANDGTRCVVTWHNFVPELWISSIMPAAISIYNVCSMGGILPMISGHARLSVSHGHTSASTRTSIDKFTGRSQFQIRQILTRGID
jgi:hypothetical protein